MIRLWRYLRSYNGIVWLALIGLAIVVALGVAETVANIATDKMLTMTLIALLFGWFIATARVTSWLGALSGISLGLEYLLIFWTNLGEVFWGLIATLSNTIIPGSQPEAVSWPMLFTEINEALQILLIRLTNWWTTVGQTSIYDPLIPQLVWGLGLWLAFTFLSWSIWQRHQAVVAVFPAGFLFALAAFFSGELYNEMTLFLAFLIILQASSQGFKRQHYWQTEQIDYATSLSLDLAMTVIPLAALIVGLAFLAPTISIRDIARRFSDLLPWQAPQTEAVVSSFGLKQAPSPFFRAGLTGLPRSHLLGNSPELGKQLVMTIHTGELAPVPYFAEEFMDVDVPRHYWQSATYSRYTSFGWSMPTTDAIPVDPEIPLNPTGQGPGRIVTQLVDRGYYDSNLLHTSGLPLTVDKVIEANYMANGDLAIATLEESQYTATSWVIDNDPELLQAAGTNYPRTIEQVYLALPQSLPTRVRDLALELTAKANTPYDKAIALETYLREFPYNLEVNKPPPGTDVADYFLFELQEGYCDYYATSMTVMARAVGLPARFVIGYVSGYYDPEGAVYRVTEAEAHSWTQIYFPGIGWVNFEPTAGRPEIVRETETAPDFIVSNRSGGGTSLNNETTLGRRWPSLRWADLPTVHPVWWVFIVLAGGFVVANIDYWRLRFMNAQALTDLLYQRLLTKAKQIGMVIHPGDTPYEFAQKLITYIEQEIPKSRLARFRVAEFWRIEIHAIDEPTFRGVYRLAQIFVRQKYAPPGAFSYDRDDLLIIWEELGPEITRAGRIISLTRNYPHLFSKANGDELDNLLKIQQADDE